MAEPCCDCGCPCTTPIPIPNPCTQCADTDFPSVYSTPRDWQVTISGVVAGTDAGAGGTCNSSCNPDWASNTAFFNRSVTVSPCGPLITYRECIRRCKYFDVAANGDTSLLEVNFLEISPPYREGNNWKAQVRMAAWFMSRFHPGLNNTTDADGCENVTGDYGTVAPGTLTVIARSRMDITLSREAPSYQQYAYDTTDCPPAPECAQNPAGTLYYGCYPSGWALTGSSPTTDFYNSCRNSLDVSGASVSVNAV